MYNLDRLNKALFDLAQELETMRDEANNAISNEYAKAIHADIKMIDEMQVKLNERLNYMKAG